MLGQEGDVAGALDVRRERGQGRCRLVELKARFEDGAARWPLIGVSRARSSP